MHHVQEALREMQTKTKAFHTCLFHHKTKFTVERMISIKNKEPMKK